MHPASSPASHCRCASTPQIQTHFYPLGSFKESLLLLLHLHTDQEEFAVEQLQESDLHLGDPGLLAVCGKLLWGVIPLLPDKVVASAPRFPVAGGRRSVADPSKNSFYLVLICVHLACSYPAQFSPVDPHFTRSCSQLRALSLLLQPDALVLSL